MYDHQEKSESKSDEKQAKSKTGIKRENQNPEFQKELQLKSIIQRQENNTGLPDNLKSGIENLSGHNLDDVKVHYNSSKPAQLNAHAYAQGNQIHLAGGQEKHLAHEAWHVVQQKQGRVKPTVNINGAAVNDNVSLEKEADVMGGKALQMKEQEKDISSKVIQRAVIGNTVAKYKNIEKIWKDAHDNAQRFDGELDSKDLIKEKLGDTIKENAFSKAKKAYSTIAGEGFEPRSWIVTSEKSVMMPGGNAGADVEFRNVSEDKDGSVLSSKLDVKTSVNKETVLTSLVDTFFIKNAEIAVVWLRAGQKLTELNQYLKNKFRTIDGTKYTLKSYEVTSGDEASGGAAFIYTFEIKDTKTGEKETKTGVARIDEEEL